MVKVFPLDCCNEVMKVNYFWRDKWVFDLYFTSKPKDAGGLYFESKIRRLSRNNQKSYQEIFGVGKGKRFSLIYSYYQRVKIP